MLKKILDWLNGLCMRPRSLPVSEEEAEAILSNATRLGAMSVHQNCEGRKDGRRTQSLEALKTVRAKKEEEAFQRQHWFREEQRKTNRLPALDVTERLSYTFPSQANITRVRLQAVTERQAIKSEVDEPS